MYKYLCSISYVTKVTPNCGLDLHILATAPFQNAANPSSTYIFLTASVSPVYVVCPALATTCSLVLTTSAGVTREAAGMPAIAPAVRRDRGELYPFSSAKAGLR